MRAKTWEDVLHLEQPGEWSAHINELNVLTDDITALEENVKKLEKDLQYYKKLAADWQLACKKAWDTIDLLEHDPDYGF